MMVSCGLQLFPVHFVSILLWLGDFEGSVRVDLLLPEGLNVEVEVLIISVLQKGSGSFG